jgi:hypothetical protein
MAVLLICFIGDDVIPAAQSSPETRSPATRSFYGDGGMLVLRWSSKLRHGWWLEVGDGGFFLCN